MGGYLSWLRGEQQEKPVPAVQQYSTQWRTKQDSRSARSSGYCHTKAWKRYPNSLLAAVQTRSILLSHKAKTCLLNKLPIIWSVTRSACLCLSNIRVIVAEND